MSWKPFSEERTKVNKESTNTKIKIDRPGKEW